MGAPGYNSAVYFARCFTAKGVDMGAIKIGCSYSVPLRLKSVESLQPYDCRLVGTCPGTLFEEAVAHLWLRPHRIGGEYFHDDPEVTDFMERAIRDQKFPLPMRTAGTGMLPSMEEAKYFMLRHGLTPADLAVASDLKSPSGYVSHMKTAERPNRRFLAAMMVAALRKGHKINWPKDLSYIEAEAA